MDNRKRYEQALAAVCDAVEAAEILGVGAERAKVFCREGRLAAKRLGRDWVIARAAAEDLAKIERPAGPRPPELARKITIKKARKKRGPGGQRIGNGRGRGR